MTHFTNPNASIIPPTPPTTTTHPRVPVGLLQRQFLLLGPLPLAQLEDARPWLHDGALKAIFHAPAAASEGEVEAVLAELSALPRERAGVCLTLAEAGLPEDVAALAQVVTALAAGASTILVRLPGAAAADGASVAAFGKALHQATKPRGGAPPRELVLEGGGVAWDGATVAALHQSDVHVLAEADPIAAPTPEAPLPLAAGPGLDAVGAFVACLRTDRPDGLYTTVVVDECNTALGLVYSSAVSIRVRFCVRAPVRTLHSTSPRRFGLLTRPPPKHSTQNTPRHRRP